MVGRKGQGKTMAHRQKDLQELYSNEGYLPLNHPSGEV